MNKIKDERTEIKVSANMNATEVANYIGVGVKTIRNWTSEGKIPSIKIGGQFDILKIELITG